MIEILQYIGLILLYGILLASNLSIFIGIPGGWIALVIIFLFDLATKFSVVGWKLLVVMVALMVVGEIIESFLGVYYVHKRGASRWGVLGAFLGGLGGAIAGTMIIPVVGSVIFAFLGAFALAVLFEYLYERSADRAMKTGFSAFVGKLSATTVKFALALSVTMIFIMKSWSAI